MSKGFWARRLMAALFLAFVSIGSICPARAGDPAISETNGLVGFELGYLRDGRNGGGNAVNGEVRFDGKFHPCPNNSCSGPLRSSEVTGGQGQFSGFAGFGSGQMATPLGHDFGLQLDGDLGGVHGGGAVDATAHLFRADPAVGLFGPLVDYHRLGDAGYFRAGLEGQLYFQDFTLHGDAGYQWAQDGEAVEVGEAAYGCGYVAFYPVQTLMLLAGGGGGAGESAGFGQLEWQPSQARMPGFSLFAEGMAGTDDSVAAFVGLHYHFGAANSLEMRHRHELLLRETLCGREQFSAPGANIRNVFRVISG